MKKRSRWILIMSALLCLCTLFASCQSKKGSVNGPAETIPEEPIPESQEIDYKTIISEWTKYLKYEPAVTGNRIKANKVFSHSSGTNTLLRDIGYGFFALVSERGSTNSYKVYNVYTGVKILDVVSENCSFTAKGCILQVRQTEDGFATYNYYDNNGEKINGEALNRAQTIVDNGNGTYSVLDRAYRTENGIIVETFKAGLEIALVADKEYKGNKYIFGENEIAVYSADNKKIAELEIKDTDNEYWILANGNVLVAYSYILPDDARDYTVEANGEKYDIEYFVLDIASGAVKEIPVTFVIRDMITPAQSEYNLSVRGNYEFATVYPIQDKKLAGEPNFIVFDSAMVIITELPKIVKNQTSIYGAIDASTLIITANVSDYGTWLYSADLDGKVELYANLDGYDYREIDGGFIYNGKIYDNAMKELMDISEYEITVMNGTVFAENETDTYMIAIKSGIAELKSMALPSNTFTLKSGKVFVADGKWYTDKGAFLFDSGDYYEVVNLCSDNVVVKTSVDGVVAYYIVG